MVEIFICIFLQTHGKITRHTYILYVKGTRFHSRRGNYFKSNPFILNFSNCETNQKASEFFS